MRKYQSQRESLYFTIRKKIMSSQIYLFSNEQIIIYNEKVYTSQQPIIVFNEIFPYFCKLIYLLFFFYSFSEKKSTRMLLKFIYHLDSHLCIMKSVLVFVFLSWNCLCTFCIFATFPLCTFCIFATFPSKLNFAFFAPVPLRLGNGFQTKK